ncbi:hypothetical protein P7H20_25485 [Paenibacillus larvae]|nr:hypothetical protein [Paenibacillus larvae]MDT2277521.1 hypothetical protein [Paenibacillus larvae]
MKYLRRPVSNQFGWSLEESSAAMMFWQTQDSKGLLPGRLFASSPNTTFALTASRKSHEGYRISFLMRKGR